VAVDLSDSRVLLTGATGGIGHAIARTLCAQGAHVVLSGRRPEVLAELESELGDHVSGIAADLADPSEVARLAQEAGPVDVLVANAALPATGTLESFSDVEIDRALNINLRAPMQLARALLPAMREKGSGQIVLISSLSGKIATPTSSVYCATKFGLRGFGFALHEELRGTGVGATTVFPGFIRDAGMFADSGVKLSHGLRSRSPQQVADAVLKAIRKNPAEIDVAPFTMRAGARIFTAAPSIGSAISRAFGGDRIAAAVAAGQRDKR
jgi:short-subunit dehydrogenase